MENTAPPFITPPLFLEETITQSISWVSASFSSIFIVLLLLGFLVQTYLSFRQVRYVFARRDLVPALFKGKISDQAHHKAARYTIAKERVGILEAGLGILVVLGWTLLGGLEALHLWIGNTFPTAPALLQQLGLLLAFALIGSVVDLPFSLYRTFVLEARFGFNKTTWGLWLSDAVKGALLGAALGLPLAALVLWLMGKMGALWWLYAWAALLVFQLMMLWIFPTVIAPLFNKFSPLEDAPLRERIEKLMAKSGFKASGLFVADGSRRSAHANAYFTGMGSSKRVVFYDTLLEKLTPEEIEAVLAHELGHFKHKHIIKRLISMFIMSFLGFALLGWVMQQAWFYTGLGVGIDPNIVATSASSANAAPTHYAVALLLFTLVLPVFTYFTSPIGAWVSRKHEFQADAYAGKQANAKDLAQALLKLYEDNASTLTPDPWYVRFYYSHPPAVERIKKMGVTFA